MRPGELPLEENKAQLRDEKRRKLQEFNKLTREANKGSTGPKQHKTAWGVDQRQFSPQQMQQKLAEIEQQRSKRRSEREKALREGRTRIGLDLIPEFKYPTSAPYSSKTSSPPHQHLGKKTDPGIVEYMLQKRRKIQLEIRRKQWEAEKNEEKREEALAKLQEVQHREVKKEGKKKKKKRKGKKQGKEDKSGELPGDKQLYKRLRDLLKTKAQQLRDTDVPLSLPDEPKDPDRRTQLYQKLEQLSLQLARTRALITQSSDSTPVQSPDYRDLAARRIQRYYRRYRLKKKTRVKRNGEKTLQLSEVQAQGSKEKTDSDLSLKSFGSFLDKGEQSEEVKRQVDSLDFLAKNRVAEPEIPKSEPEDRPEPAELEEELSNRDTRSPLQPPMPPNSPIDLPTHEDELTDSGDLLSPEQLGESPRPTIGETGGSPNDSSLESNEQDKEPEFKLTDFIGDSARSLTELFEPKVRFEDEIGDLQYPATSLRIPGKGRLALNLGKVVSMMPTDPADSSPSIGSLIRGGPESPEVLSYRDSYAEQQNLWNLVPSAQVDSIVTYILDKEISDLLPFISPYVSLTSNSPVDPTSDFILIFLDLLLTELLPNETEFMAQFSRPREVNFAETLLEVANAKLGTVSEPVVEVLIPEEVFIKVCERLNVDESSLLAPYCRLMVDVVNECLNILRPESTKGMPPPWRPGTRDLRTYPSLLSLFYEVRDLTLAWSQAQIGHILPPEQPAAAQIQEEHLATQLLRDVSCMQILVEDKEWTDYEQEELQVKLDTADVLLEQLVKESLALLGV